MFYFIPVTTFSYTDESHFSKTFGTTRFFRVFTPLNYDPNDRSLRYPVIYYFHGCGGSYERSGSYSYREYGLVPPEVRDRPYDREYEYSNNADFENVSTSKNVLIVAVDGRIAELPEGCQVYFPSQADSWEGNYYNFSAYIRELIQVVEERYNTKTGPQNRAVSGLSMGGHMATWVAATNPHLFSSAAQHCYGPNFYQVGEPSYQTTVDLKEMWRNLRGLPFRHATTNRDYIRYYTDQLFHIYQGGGFDNEYFLDDYCHHAATRIDLQIDFHRSRFLEEKEKMRCFSHLNLYPNFEIWGYNVSSSKKGNGWIYLNNVTANGMGIYTRERLPWGKSLGEFNVNVTTPAIYRPEQSYTISRYSYRYDAFSHQDIATDAEGRLVIPSSGGMGEEIGIIGADIQPGIIVLSDTINENIYLEENTETALAVDVVNLSMKSQKVDFSVSTANTELLSILKQPEQVTIPAQSKIRIDSFVTYKGNFLDSMRNSGYIEISSSINGIVQDRKQIIQVWVKNRSTKVIPSDFMILDGRSEELPLFKYKWGEWDNPITTGVIAEGSGNGNGIAEEGEAFSIWIKIPEAVDVKDRSTWHPVVPVNSSNNRDVSIEKIMHHNFSTGRDVLSAVLKLNRNPTKENPVRIPVQTELLKVEYLENDCHRNAADYFTYGYFDLLLDERGNLKVDYHTK